MTIFDEFKKFAVKGNVVDMGVGIVIGAAFTTIVKSFVADIINPLINTDGEGLDPVKLQAYIDLIPPEEISEDITNMYNFIIGKL